MLDEDLNFVAEPTNRQPVIIVPASNITPARTQWLWPNVIPLKEACVFGGLPDCGKSSVGIATASCVTNYTEFPGGVANPLGGPKKVLMLVSEDSLQETVVPRLMAAKADLNLIGFVTAVRVDEGATHSDRMLAFDTDADMLEARIAKSPDVRLVIIDPLASYIGKAKKNAEEDVRKILLRLKEMAENTNTAVLILDHFNKNRAQSAMHRFSGSQAMSAVPRSVWMFTKDVQEGEKDEDEEKRYLMLCVKLNIVKNSDKKGKIYRFKSVDVEIEGTMVDQPVVEWLGTTNRTADEVLSAINRKQDGDGRVEPSDPKLEQACQFLQNELADGPKLSAQIYEDATALSLSESTVQSAGKRLNVEHTKLYGKRWYMSLPGDMRVDESVTKWLRDLIGTRQVPAAELWKAAEESGHKERTIRRVAKVIDIPVTNKGGVYVWGPVPDGPPAPLFTSAEDAMNGGF